MDGRSLNASARVRCSLAAAVLTWSCAAADSAGAAPGCESPVPDSVVAGEPGAVTVRLTNRPERGRLRLLLFASADAFGDLRDARRVACFDLQDAGEMTLSGVEPGEYALLVHFDVDANGVLDRNILGIPVEPIAFSNDYRPKGPPAYARARFVLDAGEVRSFDLRLERPLGEAGRISAGIGAIGQSSPYVDYDGSVSRVIPVVTYIGERLQVLGPRVRYGIAGRGRLRLAATARLRLGAYEQDRSPVLDGLGDREDTLMAGLALVFETPVKVDLLLAYDHDVLDRAGGGAARLALARPFQVGVARVSPRIGLEWLSAELSAYEFGVPARLARESRPAYEPGATASWEIGIGTLVEVTRSVRVIADVAVRALDDDLQASPLVDGDRLVQALVALDYTF